MRTIYYFVPSIYKSCALFAILLPRFINHAHYLLFCSPWFDKSFIRFTILFPRFINHAHDIAYYLFPACHVRGSVENTAKRVFEFSNLYWNILLKWKCHTASLCFSRVTFVTKSAFKPSVMNCSKSIHGSPTCATKLSLLEYLMQRQIQCQI